MSIKSEIEKLSFYLSTSGANLFDISRKTGISYNTIRQLRDGSGNPTASTLATIEEYLTRANPEKSCETCKHCLVFDRSNSEFGCLLFGSADDEPDACMMHKEI